MVAAPRATARDALRRCVAAGAGGVAVAGLYKVTGLGFPCPFLIATGLQCPFCGGTRMGSALLAGDLAAAWAFNPLLLLVGVALLARAVGWVVEAVRHPADRPAARWLPGWVHRHWEWVLAVVGVGYIVGRALL